MRITAAPALLALALLVGAAGCGDDAADATDPATSTATPEASAPPFPADTLPQDSLPVDAGGPALGNGLGLTGVRTERHPGYDRVILDLGGTGTPGWRVEYVARPIAEGSGDLVTLQGTVFLQVVLDGVGLPFDNGIPPFGDDTTRVPGTGTHGVREIKPGGVYEGLQQAFIGLSGAERPFRVFALTDPDRVVVDVLDN